MSTTEADITIEQLGNRYRAIGALMSDKREQCMGNLFIDGSQLGNDPDMKAQACAVGVIFSELSGVKTAAEYHTWQLQVGNESAYKFIAEKLGIPMSAPGEVLDVDQIWMLNDTSKDEIDPDTDRDDRDDPAFSFVDIARALRDAWKI